ncbi:alpha/beta hydrolase [Duganella sp. Root1480D1]|uniref:alpha/beta hydrolase n=1 Tax=Duganella sp. Root1480D1 TaxID=1736471 RepID=UPI00070D979B|nr:alpha/beta hydrolase [Duganella sp. Root1480D1]KQZ26217.1 hypothetical protein ASD58_16355 [Duganella sp. Root1480D1]
MKRRTVRWLFLAWALVSTGWLANSYRTRGVGPALLAGSVDADENLFLPAHAQGVHSGLVFICGSGVAAEAYVPMLHPVADAGFPVVIIKLPLRFAPLDSNKDEALQRVRRAMAAHGDIRRWVVAGHSLGGALAARLVHDAPNLPAARWYWWARPIPSSRISPACAFPLPRCSLPTMAWRAWAT